MRYEPPCIARRELLKALLTVADSNVKPDNGAGISDVRVKRDIVPVTFGDEPAAYTPPHVTSRERLEGLLLDTTKSDTKPVRSDVHVKDAIVPVRW